MLNPHKNTLLPRRRKNMKPTDHAFRTKVFRRAYEIREATGKTFEVCLAKSWALFRLEKAMERGVVRFAYEKTDGSLRKARGTLKDVKYVPKTTRAENIRTFVYYDMEARSFRCFRIENLITVY